MGKRRRKGRDISGFLLLDKPRGPTSNAVLQQVMKIFFARKAGHTGSLDPIATGLLPICFGRATRFSMFLLDADKRYLVTAKLGITTGSGDCEGEITAEKPVGTLSRAAVEKILPKFTGDVLQVPPMLSAVKVEGKPLYKYAQEGKEVTRRPRKIRVHSLDLVDIISDSEIVLDVFCSKGTYVRTLIEGIGSELGMGAHVSELSRTALANFTLDEAVTIETLEKLKSLEDNYAALNAAVKPADAMLKFMPKVKLNINEKFYISHGQPIRVADAPKSGMARMYAQDKFIGIGEILDDGRVAPKRLM